MIVYLFCMGWASMNKKKDDYGGIQRMVIHSEEKEIVNGNTTNY